ncbi:MAG: DMT family transporter [Candidatus Thorarchaeota archaeon]|nr:MAG: DMT family transporter [Candidatus Thorarchaeota archaeon]
MQAGSDLVIGVAAGFLGAALYALSVVVYRSQADEIRPLAISSIKMWVAWPFMLFMTILIPGIAATFLPLVTIALLGTSVMFGAVVGDTVYLWSQERIGVSYAFPIAMSFPILTFFLTVAFLGEPLILSRLAGAVIAVIGVIMISNEQNRKKNDVSVSERQTRFVLLGIAGAILTMVLYATGTTLLQVAIEGVNPIAGNLVRVSFGSVAFVPMIVVARYSGMSLPTRRATKLVIIAGFFGMALGSLLYVTAVSYLGAAIMSVIASTAPLFAVPVSVFYLKEKLTRFAVAGIALTLLGVFMVILGDAFFMWFFTILGQP